MNVNKKIDLIFSSVLYFGSLFYFYLLSDNFKDSTSFLFIGLFSYIVLFYSLKKESTLMPQNVLAKLSDTEISLMLKNKKLKEVEVRLLSVIGIFIAGLTYGFCLAIYMFDFYQNFTEFQQLNLVELKQFLDINATSTYILNVIPALFMGVYGIKKLAYTFTKPLITNLENELHRREKEA